MINLRLQLDKDAVASEQLPVGTHDWSLPVPARLPITDYPLTDHSLTDHPRRLPTTRDLSPITNYQAPTTSHCPLVSLPIHSH